MSHPHRSQADRDAIEDRGLVDDDRTEMLTAPATPVFEHQAEAAATNPIRNK